MIADEVADPSALSPAPSVLENAALRFGDVREVLRTLVPEEVVLHPVGEAEIRVVTALSARKQIQVYRQLEAISDRYGIVAQVREVLGAGEGLFGKALELLGQITSEEALNDLEGLLHHAYGLERALDRLPLEEVVTLLLPLVFRSVVHVWDRFQPPMPPMPLPPNG